LALGPPSLLHPLPLPFLSFPLPLPPSTTCHWLTDEYLWLTPGKESAWILSVGSDVVF
jgi:hypothetical protein